METRVRLDSLKQGESFRFWGTVRTMLIRLTHLGDSNELSRA